MLMGKTRVDSCIVVSQDHKKEVQSNVKQEMKKSSITMLFTLFESWWHIKREKQLVPKLLWHFLDTF